MSYEDLLKTFYASRRDYSFPSSALDSLNDEQRKNIEALIVKSCLNGDTSCFDHIIKLKFYDPKKIFTIETMSNIELSSRLRLIDIMYEVTKDNKYVDYLVNLSYVDIRAFSMLTLMFMNNVIPKEYYANIINICKSANEIDNYLKIASRVVSKEELDEIRKNWISPKFSDDFGINHDQELYRMITSGNQSGDGEDTKNNIK